jgi:hypothetical protein
VGKNNAGKSAFLEAVELYASNASLSTIVDLVESRQETWTGAGKINSRILLNNPVRHLFYGHKLPLIDEAGISLGEISDSTKLHITVAAYKTDFQPDGSANRIRLTSTSKADTLEDVELVLISEEDKLRRILSLSDSFYFNGSFSISTSSSSSTSSSTSSSITSGLKRRYALNYLEGMAAEFKYPWQVVHTQNMSNRQVAALWDLTSLTELESAVIDALKLIEPKVTGVAFVEDFNNGSSHDTRIPLVKIDGSKEPLPLKSMGDGMTRLFHIIVALVNAQNGILLVDEFENGLYWKVQPKVWDVVFQLADRLNVQVFATTHSRDCIRAFDEAWNKHLQSGAFFRLDARPEGVKITEYNAETLTDAIETDVEVR